MHATRAAVEEGIVPGGGVALLRASEQLKQHQDRRTTTRRPASRSSARRCPGPLARSRSTQAKTAPSSSARSSRRTSIRLRLRLADRRIRQPDLQGHHRPDQGGSRGDPERSLGCGSADHHRSHGRRTAEEERRRRWRYAPGRRRHGRHGFLIQPLRQLSKKCKTPAAMPGFLFGPFRHSGARRLARARNPYSRSWLWILDVQLHIKAHASWRAPE